MYVFFFGDIKNNIYKIININNIYPRLYYYYCCYYICVNSVLAKIKQREVSCFHELLIEACKLPPSINHKFSQFKT